MGQEWVDLRRLRRAIGEVFDEEELRTLCFDLRIEYGDLPATGRAGKIRELVAYCDRNDLIADLFLECQHQRPRAPWHDLKRTIDLAKSPYKGLQYFDQEDADIFFGREALTTRLASHLRQNRFLAVVGASGSGKSSVVRAGLIPALKGWPLSQDIKLPKGSEGWPVHIITPKFHPLEALALSLTRDIESVTAAGTLKQDLATNEAGLHLYVSKMLAGSQTKHLLLVVDQFEEIFTQCKEEAERKAFVDNLVYAAAEETAGPTIVVITLRGDFYNHCLRYERLHKLLEEKQRIVGRMTSYELHQAIEEPARKGHLEFEEGLVDLMLEDIGAAGGSKPEPGDLPLLSHALLETWKRREGQKMTRKGYRASGGVQGAIAKTAQITYRDLSAEEQTIARMLFLELTELGEGTQDTRRRITLEQLRQHIKERAALDEVIEVLAASRLITTDREVAPGQEPQIVVEVSHEAIIRKWDDLRDWLDQNREGLRLHRQLSRRVNRWVDLNRDEAVLYRGVELAQAKAWAAENNEHLSDLECQFLLESLEAIDEEERRQEAIRQRELQNGRDLAETRRRLLEEEKEKTQTQERLLEEGKQRESLQRKALIGLGILATIAVGLLVVAIVASLNAGQKAEEALQAQSMAEAESTRADQNLVTAISAQGTAVSETTRADQNLATAVHSLSITERKEAEAHSLALAANAGLQYNEGHYLLALALAVEANKLQNSPLLAQQKLAEIAYAPGIRRLIAHHTARINDVAVNPDKAIALSGSSAGELILWHVGTGEIIHNLIGHEDAIYGVAISPDGRTALSGTDGGTLIQWDLETGKQIQQLQDQGSAVTSVAFNPDGRTALSGFLDGTLIEWNLQTGLEMQRFTRHADAVMSIDFDEAGRTALTGSLDNTMILWDLDSGEAIRDFYGHEQDVMSVALSPDGRTALSGSCGIIDPKSAIPSDDTCIEGQLGLWNIETGEMTQDLRGHSDFVVGVAFGRDGQTAISATYGDPTFIIWDISKGEPRHTIRGGEGIRTLSTYADGYKALTGQQDGTLLVWDLYPAQPVLKIDGGSEHRSSFRFDTVKDMAFNPENNTGMSAGCSETFSGFCELGNLVLWDLNSGQPSSIFQGHSADIGRPPIHSVALSPDGRLAASAGCGHYEEFSCSENDLIIWDIESNSRLHTYTGPASIVNDLVFSPDNRTLLLGYEDGTVILWDVEAGEPQRQFAAHPKSVDSIAFSPDGLRFFTGSCILDEEQSTCDRGKLSLWDAQTGEHIKDIEGHTGSVLSVAFSPDGQKFITGSADNTLILWDLATGKPERTFVGHTTSILDVAFSPDGQTILSGSEGGGLILWDLETGEQLQLFNGHPKGIHSVAFASDGKSAVSASYDGTVIIWRVDAQTEMVEWTNQNRAIIVPDCRARELYGIEPKC